MTLIRFDTNPSFRLAPRGRMQLCDALAVSDYTRGIRYWYVPVDFVTDGCSIPSWAWAFVGQPFSGMLFFPAVLHDFLSTDRSHGLSSRSCARIFRNALASNGVGRFRRTVMYWALLWRGEQWSGE